MAQGKLDREQRLIQGEYALPTLWERVDGSGRCRCDDEDDEGDELEVASGEG